MPSFMMRASRPLWVQRPLDELVSVTATEMLNGVMGDAFERRTRQFVMLVGATVKYLTGGDCRGDEARCGFVENAAHSELVCGVCDRWERALLALVGVGVRVGVIVL